MAPARAGSPRVRAGRPGRASGAEERRGRGRSRGVPPPAPPRRSTVAVTTGATAAGRAGLAPPPGRSARQAAAARPCSFPRLLARGEGQTRPPPRVSGAPAAVRARAASGRDYAKMVLQARNKHRDAAPKPPRASRSPLRGARGSGDPGPDRAPPSPGRKGAAGRKGPRAESASPPSGGGLGGRLAAGLRGALGLRRAGRGRTWTTLLLGEQPQRAGAAGRGTLSRGGPPPPLLSRFPAAQPRPRSPPVCSPLRLFLGRPHLLLPFPRLYPGSGRLAPFPPALGLCFLKNGPVINSCPAGPRTGRSALTRLGPLGAHRPPRGYLGPCPGGCFAWDWKRDWKRSVEPKDKAPSVS